MSQTSYSNTQPIAFAGMKADFQGEDVVDSFIQGEASAEVPFGVFMQKKGSGDERNALLPAGNAVLPTIGLVLHSHSYSVGANGELGTSGLKPKAALDLMVVGRAWVIAENGSAYGDSVYVRYAGTGQKGGVRSAAVNSETYKLNNARFISKSSAAGLAMIEFDLRGGTTAGS
jgi:hypothetical protein